MPIAEFNTRYKDMQEIGYTDENKAVYSIGNKYYIAVLDDSHVLWERHTLRLVEIEPDKAILYTAEQKSGYSRGGCIGSK